MGELLSQSDRLHIAQAAVLAPSADNRHCFALQFSGERILLFGNDAYLSAPFHRKILGLISFGAVAENMRVAAASLGYQAGITWLPDPTDPSLTAELRVTRAHHSDQELDAAISRRHTNRRLVYRGPRLSDSQLAALSKGVAAIEGVSLRFMDSPTDRRKLLRLLKIAEAERFNTQPLHEELFSAVRFDVGWHQTAQEGLPPCALSVEPGMRWAFRQLARWPVMNVLRRLGLHHALGFRAACLPCRLAPHCAVLATRWPVERGAPAVGMALERLWLHAESRGLAFQPFAAPALLALHEYDDVPAGTKESLREIWRGLLADTPVVVFRIGFARAPAGRSGRPAPTAFVRP